MAKRIIDWTVDDNGNLSLNKYNSDKDAQTETIDIFDLGLIYKDVPENFADWNQVQKHLAVYGAKQLLADSGANAVGDLTGKVESAQEKWSLWLENKLAAPRANSTGGAENKRILSTVKTASKVVSLEGLMLKKITFPETFTKDDQKKLDEFMKIAAKK